jgi:4-amino-4-deoxy-L-arabinose transferase-like glycosyltransferase
VLAGLAAATKYSGLVAVVSAVLLLAIRVVCGPRRLLAVRNAAIVIALCAAVGGWKYVDNYRRFGTLLYANGTAVQGFAIDRDPGLRGHYEFTTLRPGALMRIFGPRAPRGTLTDLAVYHSVPTTLHALAWSDMSFFSEPTRHGDPTHPYPRKRLPARLIGAVLVLAFVPELLAAVGFVVTLRRPLFWPSAIVCVVATSAYVWWFISQESWGLKTKYLLFLLPAFAVYTVSGFAFLWKHAPRLSAIAGVLIVALFVVTVAYLLAFALG